MTSLLQEDEQTPTPATDATTEELLSVREEPQQQPSSIELNMNHNIRDNMEEETLPPSDILWESLLGGWGSAYPPVVRMSSWKMYLRSPFR